MTKVPENVVSSDVRRFEVAVNSISIRSRSLSGRPSLVGPGVSLQTVSAIEPVIWPAFTLNLNGCDRVDAGERLSGTYRCRSGGSTKCCSRARCPRRKSPDKRILRPICRPKERPGHCSANPAYAPSRQDQKCLRPPAPTLRSLRWLQQLQAPLPSYWKSSESPLHQHF